MTLTAVAGVPSALRNPQTSPFSTIPIIVSVGGAKSIASTTGPKFIHYVVKHIHFLLHRTSEMTLDLEANEVEVKVLTSHASVAERTGRGVRNGKYHTDSLLPPTIFVISTNRSLQHSFGRDSPPLDDYAEI